MKYIYTYAVDATIDVEIETDDLDNATALAFEKLNSLNCGVLNNKVDFDLIEIKDIRDKYYIDYVKSLHRDWLMSTFKRKKVITKMLMEFKLSEEKAEKFGYDIEKYYEVTDEYFISRGCTKVDTGVYQIDGPNAYAVMSVGHIALCKASWFTDIVEWWYWRVHDNDDIEDRDDCLETYLEYQHLFKK